MAHQQEAKPAGTPDVTTKAIAIVVTDDVRVTEYIMRPGDNHPWHSHSIVSDRFYCLEGEVGVETRGAEGSVTLHAGADFSVPPGVVHHAYNAGKETARYLLIQALGHYDFIRAA